MTIWDAAMDRALAAARQAGRRGDVPVGAVVLGPDGGVLAEAGNERELTGDPTAHAEVVALRRAAAGLGRWRLEDCTLVVTLEPCAMCAGACVLARIDRIVYGALDPKAGAIASLFDVVRDPRLNHRPAVTGGVRAEECGRLIRSFFGKLPPGDVSEWPMELASKASVGQPTEGSNPSVTARSGESSPSSLGLPSVTQRL